MRRIGPKAIWKMREIAIEEVTAEGLLLQMNRTQIFEKDEKGDGQIEECHQGENRSESG